MSEVVVVRCFFHVIRRSGFGLESSRYLDLRDGSSKSVVPYIVAATQRHVCVTARHGRAKVGTGLEEIEWKRWERRRLAHPGPVTGG